MTDAEQVETPESPVVDDVTAAIERLLTTKPTPEPKAEAPAETPEPAQETTEEAEDAPSEPSAEVEGGLVETKEPEKPKAVEREAAPETAKKPSEPNPQDQLLAQLNTLVPQLEAAIKGEFSDIKTFEDLQKVAGEDPARYNRYVIHQAQLQHAQGEQQRLQMDAHNRFITAQVNELKAKFPDYVDPVKGPALRAEFTEYAAKQGFDEARMRTATAADILTLKKAMEWDRYQAAKAAEPAKVAEAQAKAKEKAAKAPLVQKPGARETNERADRVKEVAQKFHKSGHTDDLAVLLRETGIA